MPRHAIGRGRASTIGRPTAFVIGRTTDMRVARRYSTTVIAWRNQLWGKRRHLPCHDAGSARRRRV